LPLKHTIELVQRLANEDIGGYREMTPPKHILSAATIVINQKQEILLIRGPRRGWEMPGGQVEEGESLKEAAIRETKEESGIDIEITKFCGISQNVSGSICNTLFLARPIGGKLTTSPESVEVGFFPIQEALEMVTWKNFRQRIEYCLNEELHPFYIEV
jgi:8-oxo-dGTP diphosphatase